ncbi:hypothetical protein DHEL01_v207799 [Diaporthe helianthi]|uniref:Heme haloperoxidase family profile domain-containing protein n=1 Tax=Diaporthe helianthi TaxID=158607 RepID=A0A2P5HU86_DIAHE|nr:hypothetical protein DHEL01_v207799 [Diaporthe helianthi]
MRASLIAVASCALSAHALAVRQAEDPDFRWRAPEASAKRSPCPILNALANHAYLPPDGKEISMRDLKSGFARAINVDEALVETLGTPAFALSTTGNPDTFNLDDLSKHNAIEHDGSLSRADFGVTGDATTFNATVWGETLGYLEAGARGSTVGIQAMATARYKRVATAQATNPKFNLTSSQLTLSINEAAVILGTLGGSFTDPAVPLDWMRVVFEQERLPFNEGFSAPSTPITAAQLSELAQLISASTNATI